MARAWATHTGLSQLGLPSTPSCFQSHPPVYTRAGLLPFPPASSFQAQPRGGWHGGHALPRPLPKKGGVPPPKDPPKPHSRGARLLRPNQRHSPALDVRESQRPADPNPKATHRALRRSLGPRTPRCHAPPSSRGPRLPPGLPGSCDRPCAPGLGAGESARCAAALIWPERRPRAPPRPARTVHGLPRGGDAPARPPDAATASRLAALRPQGLPRILKFLRSPGALLET